MIRVDELMIGDWMLINGNPMQIEAIDSIDDEIVANGDLYCLVEDRVHSEDKCKPIPITPEILEKNGFEREDWIDNKGRFVSADGRLILQNDENFINSLNTWYIHIDNEDFETIGSCELTYVHQLQHALRLFGIDKQITL